MPAAFSNKQVAAITGLSERNVLFYNRLVPIIEGSGLGRGRPRLYDGRSLFKFLVIKQIADFGITIGRMPEVLKQVDYWEVELFLNFKGIPREVAVEWAEEGRKQRDEFRKFIKSGGDPDAFPEVVPEWCDGGPKPDWWDGEWNLPVLKIMSFQDGEQKILLEIQNPQPLEGEDTSQFLSERTAGMITVDLSKVVSVLVINLHRLHQICTMANCGAWPCTWVDVD